MYLIMYLTAFKKNDFDKFQMVTNPESVPEGTELWKSFRGVTVKK